ncbi:MAG: hypothetical protein ACLQFR_26780 [Streptosporangiaceae bacterium]
MVVQEMLLRHPCPPGAGAASMLIASGQPVKVVSEIMGHSTSSFTNDVYVTVLEELNEAAAQAISAYIPRRASNVPAERR